MTPALGFSSGRFWLSGCCVRYDLINSSKDKSLPLSPIRWAQTKKSLSPQADAFTPPFPLSLLTWRHRLEEAKVKSVVTSIIVPLAEVEVISQQSSLESQLSSISGSQLRRKTVFLGGGGRRASSARGRSLMRRNVRLLVRVMCVRPRGLVLIKATGF